MASRSRCRRVCRASALFLFLVSPLFAQNPPAGDSASVPALRVFLDCNTNCDTEYLRQTITFVNFVRDRQVAQVHVLITGQETGGGGTAFALRFIGLDGFAGVDDELQVFTTDTDTDDEERARLAHALELGLVRYLARLPAAQYLGLVYNAPAVGQAQGRHDPWNYWVFELSADGFLSGESRTREHHLELEVSASRVTDASKFLFSLEGRESKNTFEVDSSRTVIGRSSGYNGFALLVRSLSPHWSLGGTASVNASTSENLDWQARIGPALEYDIYPYSESTRRQITLLYQVGYQYADYTGRTIFGKTREGLASQSFIVSADITQPWGNVNAQLEAFNYLNDFSKNRLEVFGELEIRLFRGLELDLFGSYERVRDQVNLPAEGATPEDVLLELKELQTSYRYEIAVGLSYTFGSIFNNVVNSRFDPLD